MFLTKGTKVAYEAAEDDTEFVYVTYPHWMDAPRQSEHAALLDSSAAHSSRKPSIRNQDFSYRSRNDGRNAGAIAAAERISRHCLEPHEHQSQRPRARRGDVGS